MSEEEAQEQRKSKPDPARQYGMHLDGKLTLQQKMWLLAQLRQPGRSIFKDLTRSTFDDLLRIPLNRQNFNCWKEVDGQLLSQPCWSHCLSYEHEIRKDAHKLCRLQSIGITAALRQVTSDNEHRTQHWVQLIAVASSSGANDAKIGRLEKEVEELKSAVHRSQSPRMRPKQGALPQSQMLALPAPASSSSKPKGSERRTQNKNQQKGRCSRAAASSATGGQGVGKGKGVMSFERFMDTLGQTKAFSMFHPSHKEMCFKSRKGECSDASVGGKKHSCVGCGAEGKPYNFCRCLQSKLN